MKPLIYIITALIFSVFVVAESLEIKLIQYVPESTSALIQIKNIDKKSLHNVTISVDNSEPFFLVGLLFSGNAVVLSRNIPSGIHNITINTKEGITVTKELLFTKSKEEVKKEQELKNTNKTIQEKDETLTKEKDDEKTTTRKKGKILPILFFVMLFLFIVAGGVFWYVNFGHKKKIRQSRVHRTMPQPIMAGSMQPMMKSQQQIRQEFKNRAMRRQELLRRIINK